MTICAVLLFVSASALAATPKLDETPAGDDGMVRD